MELSTTKKKKPSRAQSAQRARRAYGASPTSRAAEQTDIGECFRTPQRTSQMCSNGAEPTERTKQSQCGERGEHAEQAECSRTAQTGQKRRKKYATPNTGKHAVLNARTTTKNGAYATSAPSTQDAQEDPEQRELDMMSVPTRPSMFPRWRRGVWF